MLLIKIGGPGGVAKVLEAAGDLGRDDAGEGEFGDGVFREECHFEGLEAGAGSAGLDLAMDEEFVDVKRMEGDVEVPGTVENGQYLEGERGEAGPPRRFRG